MFSLKEHIAEQIAWSEATFGPREVRNHVGPLNHLIKEIEEIRKDPEDIVERVDALFLVIDATWRAKSEHLDLFPTLWDWDQARPAADCTEHDYLGWLEDEARSRAEAREGVIYGYLHLFRYALCSALCAGFTLEALGEVMKLKLATNKERKWPDWRTVQAGQPIEHVRSDEEQERERILAICAEISEMDAAARAGVTGSQLQEELDEAMAADDAQLEMEMAEIREEREKCRQAELRADEAFRRTAYAQDWSIKEQKKRRDAFTQAALTGLLAYGALRPLTEQTLLELAEEAQLAADACIAQLDKTQA